MPFEGGTASHESEHEKSEASNEGGLTAWEQLRRRRLQEGGWHEGPQHGKKPVRGGDVVRVNAALATAKNLFEGVVTDVPFNAKIIRSRRWYAIYSLRASSLLFVLRQGKTVILNFPGTDLKQLFPVLETFSKLPYLLHVKFKGKKYVSAREYDRAAKELLSQYGDVFGKTGALQAVLAYTRARQKMQNLKNPPVSGAKVSFILNMKTTRRGSRRPANAPTAMPKPLAAIPPALRDLPDAPPGLYEKVEYGPGGGGTLPEGVNLISSRRVNKQWEKLTVYYRNGQVREYRRRLR
ncbi:hypothetical protein HY604_02025 [Candidatus Peregrinibacteria bacterium]|nr:hypothetical protein [Candidatus Peregrinibacteria bacterium]